MIISVWLIYNPKNSRNLSCLRNLHLERLKKADWRKKILSRLGGLGPLCMEQYTNGWLGSCPKSNYGYDLTTITLKRLIKRRYEAMLNYYRTVSPKLNEALCTRPVRKVVLDPHLVSYNWRGGSTRLPDVTY